MQKNKKIIIVIIISEMRKNCKWNPKINEFDRLEMIFFLQSPRFLVIVMFFCFYIESHTFTTAYSQSPKPFWYAKCSRILPDIVHVKYHIKHKMWYKIGQIYRSFFKFGINFYIDILIRRCSYVRFCCVILTIFAYMSKWVWYIQQ